MKETKKDSFKKNDSPNRTRDNMAEEYTYQSAGIRERHGYIPVWLILVAIGLMVWGGYYLFRYWSPAG